MATLAEKIKALRLEQGLTQPQLAKLVGVSNGTISFWENGLNRPRSDYVIKIAEALNTSSEYLLDNENESDISYIQPEDELLLLRAYRQMSEGKKRALFQMLDLDVEAINKKKA